MRVMLKAVRFIYLETLRARAQKRKMLVSELCIRCYVDDFITSKRARCTWFPDGMLEK